VDSPCPAIERGERKRKGELRDICTGKASSLGKLIIGGVRRTKAGILGDYLIKGGT